MQNPLPYLRRRTRQQQDGALHRPEPAIFVIFGITGNLAQHKLLPALYHLLKDNLLHEHTEIIGVSRGKMSVDELLNKVELCVLENDNVCDPNVLKQFKKQLRMVHLDPINPDDYDKLLETLNTIEDKHGMCMNRLYYLSIPPQVYEPVINNFGRHHLNEGCPHHSAVSRLLVEKPFGYDLTSARELVDNTAKYFTEEQVFRIDHYLAKETAQNILVFREHNPIFSSIWDRRHVSAIDLKFSEKIGIEGRADFYDNVGALRDVVQNHMMQLLALTTMELPKSRHGRHSLHRAKRNVLAAIKPADIRTVIRGQYDGYQEEVKNPGSRTETFVQLQLAIANNRWRGVPVTLTAGKALNKKEVSISINFTPKKTSSRDRLTFRIQPNEGIDVELTVKQPGFDDKTDVVRMDFSYKSAFIEPGHPDAYERVLVDAVRGDHSLFATSAEVLEAWRVLQPILTAWERSGDDVRVYKAGSAGPA